MFYKKRNFCCWFSISFSLSVSVSLNSVFSLHLFLCTTCMLCPRRPEEGVGSPRAGVTDSCELPCRYWELGSVPQVQVLCSWLWSQISCFLRFKPPLHLTMEPNLVFVLGYAVSVILPCQLVAAWLVLLSRYKQWNTGLQWCAFSSQLHWHHNGFTVFLQLTQWLPLVLLLFSQYLLLCGPATSQAVYFQDFHILPGLPLAPLLNVVFH